jgi:hypothetical protein
MGKPSRLFVEEATSLRPTVLPVIPSEYKTQSRKGRARQRPIRPSDLKWLFADIATITLDPGTYVACAVWGSPPYNADPFRQNSSVTESAAVAYMRGCVIDVTSQDPILAFPCRSTTAGGMPVSLDQTFFTPQCV